MTNRSPEILIVQNRTMDEALRDGRLQKNKTLDESAQVLGLSLEALEAYERGDSVPSLPELESLAYYYDLPIEFFTENTAPASPSQSPSIPNFQQYIRIRQRIIGVTLRQARLDAGLTIESLAEKAKIDRALLETFELGKDAIPLPQLILLSGLVDRTLRDFQDQMGPIGKGIAQKIAIREFLSLPLELQLFVSKPVNRPFLDLAVRLSQMSVDRLRAVAEGLLEITY